MFTGFTQETSQFIWDLMFHNERPWFQAHKEEFQRHLKEPFDALARDTHAEMLRRHPDGGYKLHISRIYRDARRLFGRGPYKDHLWFSLKTWDGLLRGPMFWFEIGAAEYSYGMGFYSASPAQMEAYRAAIDANPAFMEGLAQRLRDQSEFRLTGEPYKRPRADRGELLNPWYNRKWVGIECGHDFGGPILTPELPQLLCDGFDFLMPYYEFLSRFCTADQRDPRPHR